MQQLLIQNGKIFIEEIPAPSIKAGHILVKVSHSLISTGTEITSISRSGKSLLQKAIEQPKKAKQVFNNIREAGIRQTFSKVQGKLNELLATGYSCSGIVIEVGEGIQDICIGDHVACAGAGVANHAELVLVPRNLLVKVPLGCDLKQAASVTLGAIALQGVRRADPCLGETVAVVGLGLLGQISVQLLKANGCQVIGLDLDERRVQKTIELGAEIAFSPRDNFLGEIKHLTENRGVDVTIITAASNSNSIIQLAMEITRKKGRVVVVGAVGLGLERSPFYEKEIDLLISSSYGPGRYDELYEQKGLDYPYAYVRWTENRNMDAYLRLVAKGNIRVKEILDREVLLNEAPQMYELLQNSSEKPLGVLISYLPLQDNQKALKFNTKITLRKATSGDKINVALIGAGNFARTMHLPNLKILNHLYHLVAISSTNGVNAKNVARQFEAEYATTSFEDILSNKNIDLVMICTRHHLHAQQVLAALQAGKNVFVEKPLALTKIELNHIEEFFRTTTGTNQPLLMTGYNRRFSPFVQQIHDLTSHRRDPMMINYRMNAGYIPLDHWVHTTEGGGRNLGEACHIYDLFTYLTQSEIVDVSVQAINPKTSYYSFQDNFVASVKFQDGSVGNLIYTALGTPEYSKEQMDIYVDGKIFTLDNYKKLMVYTTKMKGLESNKIDKGHLNELKVIGHALKEKNTWPIPLWQQIQVAKCALEIQSVLER